MKLLNYEQGGISRGGAFIHPEQVFSFTELGFPWKDVQDLCDDPARDKLEQLEKRLDAAVGGVPLGQVRILPLFPEVRGDIICIGFNFRTHAQEVTKLRGEKAANAEVSYPIYFSKRLASVTGDGDDIPWIPGYATDLDVGVEVCPIIGWDAKNVSRDQVPDVLLGYTICNDVCDTTLNKIYTQPFLGKSVDGYFPVGPWIVTVDEFEREPLFSLELSVNGKTRQEGSTEDLVFDIPYIVSECSQDMTLKAGTMIATGSPANKDAGHPDLLRLYPGDVIQCRISGIGTLTNTVREVKL